MRSSAALTLEKGIHEPAGRAARSRVNRVNRPLGLPAPLPAGERVVWQGNPSFISYAQEIYPVRLIAAYFVIVAAWSVLVMLQDGYGAGYAVASLAFALISGGIVLGILGLIAWLGARTTVYTITNRRVLMRIGIALTKTIDIPFRTIRCIDLSAKKNGTGNISLQTGGSTTLPYLMLWPHVRPWRLRRPEPMLRAVPDAETVAQRLAAGVAEASETEAAEIDTPQPEAHDTPTGAEDDFEAARRRRMRVPLLAAASLPVLAVIIVALAQLGIIAAERPSDLRSPASVHNVTFEDIGGQRLAIKDAELGTTMAVVEPGKDGLVRNAVRGLNRGRTQNNLAPTTTYQVVFWDDGRITLSDLEAERHIPLSSFALTTSNALDALLAMNNAADL